MNKNLLLYLKAVGVISGLIIGAGIFVLPWQAAQTSFFVFILMLAVILPILIILHLIYAKIILKTEESHRFIGYVNYYYGRKAKYFASFVIFVVFWGSLLAYLILSERFLIFVFPKLGYFWASFISLFICFLPCLFNLKKISFLETLSIFIIIFISFFLLLKGKNSFFYKLTIGSGENLVSYFSLYGVLLYALYGLSAVPELVNTVGRSSEKLIKRSIIIGTSLPAIIYVFFVASFFKLFPLNKISQDGISSFASLSGGMHFLGFILGIFGLLAVVTSFWVLGSNLKNSFYLDFGINKLVGWIFVVSVPLIFYLAGFSNFMKIISFVGSFGFGLEAITIILIYKKIEKQKIGKIKNVFLVLLIFLLFVGISLNLFLVK